MPLVLVAGCNNRPDQWDAFIYPGDDLMAVDTVRGFKTFELCQEAAIDRLRDVRPDGGGSYECGHKCEYRADIDINVCKETRK